MYKSIHIQNFRGLRDLRIEDLGRVNLLVGANNVGKTSVLEALALLHMHKDGYEFRQILSSRGFRSDESLAGSATSMFGESINQRFEVRAIEQQGRNVGMLGARNPSKNSPVEFGNDIDEAFHVFLPAAPGKQIRQEYLWLYYFGSSRDRLNSRAEMISPISLRIGLNKSWRFPEPYVAGVLGEMAFLPGSFRLTIPALASLITTIENRGEKTRLLESLSGFDSRLRDVFVGFDPDWQTPVVNVSFLDKIHALPITVLGEGTRRLIEILLMVPLAAGGLTLIDEVENGVYFENLPHVWNALSSVAETAKVQVIATTHSWECVGAAVRAFRGQPDDFRLHRLERRGDEVSVLTYDHELAEAAVMDRVEVR